MTMNLQEQVDAIPYWYHKIELPDGITTPGWAPNWPLQYRLPDSFEGKRVLDVGAWDGYWTFDALQRGAAEVVAIDDFSDHVSGHLPITRSKWETFDLCREALGYSEDRCQRYDCSLYDLRPEKDGLFDVVLFFGTLYHCKYPMLALDRLSAVCREMILVETAVCHHCSIYNGGFGHGYGFPECVCEFYPLDEYGQNYTNWWVPSVKALAAMVSAAGFPDVKTWFADLPDSTELGDMRGWAKGVKA